MILTTLLTKKPLTNLWNHLRMTHPFWTKISTFKYLTLILHQDENPSQQAHFLRLFKKRMSVKISFLIPISKVEI